MKRASIDIGSNSTLLLVAEVNGSSLNVLENRSFVTQLGKDLDKTKTFCQESMDSTYNALKEYTEIVKSHEINPRDVIMTATEASRVASNAPEFYKVVSNDLGLNVQIISSDGEAYYTALGVSLGSNSSESVVIMDIGGASTEFIKVNLSPFSLNQSISLPIGVVRATDWQNENSFEDKLVDIKKLFSDSTSYNSSSIMAVAGSMTSIAGMILELTEYDDNKVSGLVISIKELEQLKESCQSLSVEDLLSKYPFLGKRAKVIKGGIDVALYFADLLNVSEFVVSTYGLRYGTLYNGSIDTKFLS